MSDFNIKSYMENLGFTNGCYRSGDGTQECISDLKGLFATIDYAKEEVRLQAIDGMIDCVVTLGYPNNIIPMQIERLRRHVPVDYNAK